jgi:hypothetical protein
MELSFPEHDAMIAIVRQNTPMILKLSLFMILWFKNIKSAAKLLKKTEICKGKEAFNAGRDAAHAVPLSVS